MLLIDGGGPDDRTPAEPASVLPGEAVSMVAYRRQDLCRDIELHLDGVRLGHRVTATIEESRAGWNSLVVSVVIPPRQACGVTMSSHPRPLW